MTVPDTNTFSLQDVVNVVQPPVDTLQSCFDNSIDSYFDINYKGAKNSLLNFRNYGKKVFELSSKVMTKYYINSGYQRTFLGAINVSTGSFLGGKITFGVRKYGTDYEVHRGFCRFETSAISGITVNNARLIYIGDNSHAKNHLFYIYATTATQSLVLSDYSSFTSQLSQSSYYDNIIINSAFLSYLQSNINNGEDTYIMFRHYNDVNKITPTDTDPYIEGSLEPLKFKLIINE